MEQIGVAIGNKEALLVRGCVAKTHRLIGALYTIKAFNI